MAAEPPATEPSAPPPPPRTPPAALITSITWLRSRGVSAKGGIGLFMCLVVTYLVHDIALLSPAERALAPTQHRFDAESEISCAANAIEVCQEIACESM